MHDLPLVTNIAISLAYAMVGGLIARRLGLPTIVGYLIAGVAVGPLTPGYRADPESIGQLAELGVILLMFGVGLHFSFRDLWQVRDIAIPGAIGQMVIITVAGYFACRLWGFTPGASWIVGIALSVASTVVLLRGFMDRGWLEGIHGRVAIGWLIFEDLATVAILVLLPALAGMGESEGWGSGLIAVGKALFFVVLMVVAGTRLVPLLLERVVATRSRELFVLGALRIAGGTALASAAAFGVSLALGAFVAGVVVNESPFSHQVAADLLPFREAFAVIFFVSVGMLVDPMQMVHQWDRVFVVCVIVLLLKPIVSALLAFAFPYPARTGLIVGAGRSQIGEFSFIVGQAGLGLGLLDREQYGLILAGAVISITVNPFVLRAVDPVERWLKRHTALWRVIDRQGPEPPPLEDTLTGHVVIVGCGRVGRHIAEALGRLNIPRLVIEVDPIRMRKLRELEVPLLYGDAASSEVMTHAALDRARAIVITLPDDAAALASLDTAHRIAPSLPAIARASTWDGARKLRDHGATFVVRPELEGGVEILRRALLQLELPAGDVQRYTDTIRRTDQSEQELGDVDRARVLDDLVGAARQLDMTWVAIEAGNPLAGRTIAESDLRARTGASVVAIARGSGLVANPTPEEVITAGDHLAVIGSPEQIERARTIG
jgi:CPA2 family monovalent cation:H+ antiporter-2